VGTPGSGVGTAFFGGLGTHGGFGTGRSGFWLGLGSVLGAFGERNTVIPPPPPRPPRIGRDITGALRDLNSKKQLGTRHRSWQKKALLFLNKLKTPSEQPALRWTPRGRRQMAGGEGKPALLVNKIRKQAAAARGDEAPLEPEVKGKGKRARLENDRSEHEKENQHDADGAAASAVDSAELDRSLSVIATRAPRLHALLLPFQREGIAFVLAHGGRALLAHDMGLGKTLQALACLAHYSHEWPALIVVPSSMRWPWVDALELWLDGLLRPGDVNVVKDGNNTAIASPTSRISIISYALMNNPSIRTQCEAARFKIVIADESHYVKDAKAKRTQALLPVLRRAKRCVLLSGTPALNRPKDLFTQLDALKPGGVGSFNDFAKRYCDAKKKPWGWDVGGGRNLLELHQVLKKNYMHRVLKNVVADQLPAKRRECVRFELSTTAARDANAAAEALVSSFKKESNGGGDHEKRFETLKALSAWGQITASAKAGDVAARVAEILESGTSKVLFFAHHHVMLDAMENALRAARVPHVRIDGRTPSLDRSLLVNRFQQEPDIRVAVLSILACGQGITLTAASDVVFGELYWVPAAMLQAEDRAHRLGQKNAVNVKFLCAAGTLDDVIWPAILRKLERLGHILDGAATDLGAEVVDGNVAADADAGVLSSLMQHFAVNPSSAGAFMAGPNGTAGGGTTTDANADDTPIGGIHAHDIRAFFAGGGGSGKTKTTPSAAIDLTKSPEQNATNANAPEFSQEQGVNSSSTPGPEWACVRCTLLNAPALRRCGACDAPGPAWFGTAAKAKPAKTLFRTPGRIESETLAATLRTNNPHTDRDVAFEVSGNTGRVFVYRRRCVGVDGGSAQANDGKNSGGFTQDTEIRTKNLGFMQDSVSSREADDGGDESFWEYANARLTSSEFRVADAAGDLGSLPPTLRSPETRAAFRVFLHEWDNLKATSQVSLANKPLRTPLGNCLRDLTRHPQGHAVSRSTRCTERYASADLFLHAGAGRAGPSVPGGSSALPSNRYATSIDPAINTSVSLADPPVPGATIKIWRGKTREWCQWFAPCLAGEHFEKTPLCLTCAAPYAETLREQLGHPFCGETCLKSFRVKTVTGVGRAQLFQLERGVCQLCGLDCDFLFQRLESEPSVPQRIAILEATGRFSNKRAAAIATSGNPPKAGDLWQADHHVPVAEGGGACDLDNFRTLCDGCHRGATSDLRFRLRVAANEHAAIGTKDIRGFWKPG